MTIEFFIKKSKVLPRSFNGWRHEDYVILAKYKDDLYIMDGGDYGYVRDELINNIRRRPNSYVYRSTPNGHKLHKRTTNKILKGTNAIPNR